MNGMQRWLIPAVLIAALLLVGAAGAARPIREPVGKIVFVHYADAPVKGAPSASTVSAFKLMGPKWDTRQFPVVFHVNPDGSGLPGTVVSGEIATAFGTWDAASARALFSNGGPAAAVAADGKNDVSFADLGDGRAIAVTTVWYTIGSKRIVEADIQMNTRMPWGIYPYGDGSTVSGAKAYDVRNIATHEVGHVCGLDDLYTGRSIDQTMYGYGSIGEVKKDTLADGDLAGLTKLYG